MSATETHRARLNQLLQALGSGQLMDVFDDLYHQDVVMSENGADDPARHGIDKNRAYEQFFMDNAEWHDARVGPVLCDGDHTGYEMWMDLSFQGQRMQRTQWALQTWKDGQIIREVFYYSS